MHNVVSTFTVSTDGPIGPKTGKIQYLFEQWVFKVLGINNFAYGLMHDISF